MGKFLHAHLAVIAACLALSSYTAAAGEASEKPAQTITEDGAWCWIGDPRAVYHEGRHKRTYVGWVNRSGDVQVGYYDHRTGKTETSTLRTAFNRDDHANPALLIREDGRILVFYSAHGGPGMLYRLSARPEDIQEWDVEMQLPGNTLGKWGYTYPNLVRVPREGRYYLFWRGGNFMPSFTWSEDGVRWSQARTFIQGPGQRPYVKYASNGTDTVVFAFTDGHPNKEKVNNIYFAQYRGGAFYRADGSLIKRIEEGPLTPSEADRVYDSGASGVRAWIWDIAIDRSGHPALVYATFPNLARHVYRYARWNGTAWENHDVTPAGGWFPQTPQGKRESEGYYSGGVTLNHRDPSILYLSKPTRGVHEIERWTTPDGGLTWESEMVTSGSSQNNVRPVVPHGNKTGGVEVIWMSGDYVHWTNYRTALKMRRASPG